MNDSFCSNLNVKMLDANIQAFASNFDCGNNHINQFLKSSQAFDDGFGKTYVWLEDNNQEIIGFYNISVGCIDQKDGESRYKMGGSIHINEFALAQKYRGVSLGEDSNANLSDALLKDCLDRVEYIRRKHIGFSFVTLQSTREGHSLYERNDFEDVEDDMNISIIQGAEEECQAMYLALDLDDY